MNLPSTFYFYKKHSATEWEIVRVDEEGVWLTTTQAYFTTGMATRNGTFGERITMPDETTRRKI